MAIDFARRTTVDARSHPGTATAYAIAFMLASRLALRPRQVKADYEAMPERELVWGDGLKDWVPKIVMVRVSVSTKLLGRGSRGRV
jgi:hypothetical protein